jgi:hypothetical protein
VGTWQLPGSLARSQYVVGGAQSPGTVQACERTQVLLNSSQVRPDGVQSLSCVHSGITAQRSVPSQKKPLPQSVTSVSTVQGVFGTHWLLGVHTQPASQPSRPVQSPSWLHGVGVVSEHAPLKPLQPYALHVSEGAVGPRGQSSVLTQVSGGLSQRPARHTWPVAQSHLLPHDAPSVHAPSRQTCSPPHSLDVRHPGSQICCALQKVPGTGSHAASLWHSRTQAPKLQLGWLVGQSSGASHEITVGPASGSGFGSSIGVGHPAPVQITRKAVNARARKFVLSFMFCVDPTRVLLCVRPSVKTGCRASLNHPLSERPWMHILRWTGAPMTGLVKRTQQVEKNKRYLALGVGAAGVVTTAMLTPILGVPLLAVGAYFGWDWFKFRAKNGMRF